MLNNFYGNQFQRPQQNSITWVQGLEGAKAFQLLPNSNVVLMDSEEDRFFIKSADNVGMCSLRSFKYTETTNEKPAGAIDTSQFVTKEEFNRFIESIKGVTANEQPISRNEQSAGSVANKQSANKSSD